MAPQRNNFRQGFTLIEIIITAVAAAIFILGITGILASGIRNYKTMYNRVTSDVVRNAYEAKIIFDRIVRKSTIKRFDPSNLDDPDVDPEEKVDLYVYYYSDPSNLNIIEPDRYAHFSQNDSQLMLEQGNVSIGTFGNYPELPVLSATSTIVIAENVYSVTFKVFMYSVEMSLILDNEIIPENTNKLETMRMTVTSTAILHNDWYDSGN